MTVSRPSIEVHIGGSTKLPSGVLTSLGGSPSIPSGASRRSLDSPRGHRDFVSGGEGMRGGLVAGSSSVALTPTPHPPTPTAFTTKVFRQPHPNAGSAFGGGSDHHPSLLPSKHASVGEGGMFPPPLNAMQPNSGLPLSSKLVVEVGSSSPTVASRLSLDETGGLVPRVNSSRRRHSLVIDIGSVNRVIGSPSDASPLSRGRPTPPGVSPLPTPTGVSPIPNPTGAMPPSDAHSANGSPVVISSPRRRASACVVSEEGAALIQKLRELDRDYGLDGDGKSPAMMALNDLEVVRLKAAEKQRQEASQPGSVAEPVGFNEGGSGSSGGRPVVGWSCQSNAREASSAPGHRHHHSSATELSLSAAEALVQGLGDAMRRVSMTSSSRFKPTDEASRRISMESGVAAPVSGGSPAAHHGLLVAAASSPSSHDVESPAETSHHAVLRSAAVQAFASHQGANETLKSASVASHPGAGGTLNLERRAGQPSKAGVMQGLAAKFANLFAKND